MADYKIKSNLNLYGNSINNFAIQADSGFPASPIMGRTQFYTGGGEYANHIVVYDGKSWKAVAYTDDVKNNADFINLKARVDAFLDGGVNSNDVLDNLREIQQFLDTYGDTTKLVDLLGEINEDIAEQADRISDLESKATQVSVSQTITAGKEIGKVTIDGNTTKLYAPANYAWNEISGTPNTIEGYGITNAITAAGGTINGGANASPLVINTTKVSSTITFSTSNVSKAQIGYDTDGVFLYNTTAQKWLGVKNDGTPYFNDGGYHTLLHTDNYALFIDKTHARNDGSNASGTWGIAITGSASSLTPYYVNNLDNALENRFFHSGFQAANRPATNYGTGFTISNSELGYLHQLAFDSDNYIYARRKKNDTWDAWKQLAFTDSDITGNAAGLKHSNGTIAAVVNSSGNVTIGATSDLGYKLQVFGTSTFRDYILADRYNGQGNTAGASILINKGGSRFGIGPCSANVNKISFGYAKGVTSEWESEVMTFDGNGNIGVGTISPQDKFHIEGSIFINKQRNSTFTTIFGGFSPDLEDGDKAILGVGKANSYAKKATFVFCNKEGDYNKSYGSLGLYGVDDLITFNGYGKVGIGTADPQYKLDVYGGEMRVSNNIYVTNASLFRSYLSDGTAHSLIGISSSNQVLINAGDTYPTIIRGGRVGIGTTTPQAKLQVAGGAIFDDSATINGKLYANAGADITGDVYVDGNVHITGNLFAEKELGGGGVGTPATGGGTGGGSAASGLFAVKRISEGVQSITLNHGLDTRNLVICIYEKDENALTEQWNMCLTDVEIISEMEIRVSFGSATTTEHKVVIMGAA